jgi:hypothetical protein
MTRVATSRSSILPLLADSAPAGWFGRTCPASCRDDAGRTFGIVLGLLGELVAGKGFAMPPRSACQGCAFRSNEEWAALTPDELASVIAWEPQYQQAVQAVQYDRAIPYLHPSRVPLGEVSFDDPPPDDRQMSLWGNECEGMCGV